MNSKLHFSTSNSQKTVKIQILERKTVKICSKIQISKHLAENVLIVTISARELTDLSPEFIIDSYFVKDTKSQRIPYRALTTVIAVYQVARLPRSCHFFTFATRKFQLLVSKLLRAIPYYSTRILNGFQKRRHLVIETYLKLTLKHTILP